MADEQQAKSKPSFKHAVAKKALAPVVASVATAATTYLMKKGAELWQERLQPKLEEQGGVEALAQRATEAVKSKVPAADSSDEAPQPEPKASSSSSSKDDRGEERQKREQRRQQRRRALEQAESS
jgi:hypothetical protein